MCAALPLRLAWMNAGHCVALAKIPAARQATLRYRRLPYCSVRSGDWADTHASDRGTYCLRLAEHRNTQHYEHAVVCHSSRCYFWLCLAAPYCRCPARAAPAASVSKLTSLSQQADRASLDNAIYSAFAMHAELQGFSPPV